MDGTSSFYGSPLRRIMCVSVHLSLFQFRIPMFIHNITSFSVALYLQLAVRNLLILMQFSSLISAQLMCYSSADFKGESISNVMQCWLTRFMQLFTVQVF
jgi:hypothetical protein